MPAVTIETTQTRDTAITVIGLLVGVAIGASFS
jgi:hypothetical protein